MAYIRKRAKKAGRRPAGRRRMPLRRYPRSYRPARNVPEWASCSETLLLANPVVPPLPIPPQGFLPNVMYQKRDFSLDQFPRASIIASAYQHFRLKKLTVSFKPVLDTFATTGTGTVPNIHYMIDKAGSIPNNPTIDQLRAMGSKPYRFDDRTKLVAWRPSVLDLASTGPGGASSAQYKVSPWLSTSSDPLGAVWNPSTVDHQGIFWMVRQDTPGNGVYFTVEITAEFQFKKPLAQSTHGAPEALKV